MFSFGMILLLLMGKWQKHGLKTKMKGMATSRHSKLWLFQ
ncbi:hypothetical protein ACP4OV_002142 [Aristida adscensionis]